MEAQIEAVVRAEENLRGLRDNLVQRVWATSTAAAAAATHAEAYEHLGELTKLHAAIKAIDFAMANKPSAYSVAAPL